MEINPSEFLYFRQDNPKIPKSNACKQEKCWQNTVGCSDYCLIHIKMFKEKGLQIMSSLCDRIAEWPKFIKQLKSLADKDDINIIDLPKFVKVLDSHGITLTQKE